MTRMPLQGAVGRSAALWSLELVPEQLVDAMQRHLLRSRGSGGRGRVSFGSAGEGVFRHCYVNCSPAHKNIEIGPPGR